MLNNEFIERIMMANGLDGGVVVITIKMFHYFNKEIVNIELILNIIMILNYIMKKK